MQGRQARRVHPLLPRATPERYEEDPSRRQRDVDRAIAWAKANPERRAAKVQEYRDAGILKRSLRKTHLKKKYGITPEDYDRMLEAQGGGCAICGRPPRDDIALHVDHDHETGFIRGLLCFPCNNALGLMKDDPERLIRAAEYVAIKRRLDVCSTVGGHGCRRMTLGWSGTGSSERSALATCLRAVVQVHQWGASGGSGGLQQ